MVDSFVDCLLVSPPSFLFCFAVPSHLRYDVVNVEKCFERGVRVVLGEVEDSVHLQNLPPKTYTRARALGRFCIGSSLLRESRYEKHAQTCDAQTNLLPVFFKVGAASLNEGDIEFIEYHGAFRGKDRIFELPSELRFQLKIKLFEIAVSVPNTPLQCGLFLNLPSPHTKVFRKILSPVSEFAPFDYFICG